MGLTHPWPIFDTLLLLIPGLVKISPLQQNNNLSTVLSIQGYKNDCPSANQLLPMQETLHRHDARLQTWVIPATQQS